MTSQIHNPRLGEETLLKKLESRVTALEQAITLISKCTKVDISKILQCQLNPEYLRVSQPGIHPRRWTGSNENAIEIDNTGASDLDSASLHSIGRESDGGGVEETPRTLTVRRLRISIRSLTEKAKPNHSNINAHQSSSLQSSSSRLSTENGKAHVPIQNEFSSFGRLFQNDEDKTTTTRSKIPQHKTKAEPKARGGSSCAAIPQASLKESNDVGGDDDDDNAGVPNSPPDMVIENDNETLAQEDNDPDYEPEVDNCESESEVKEPAQPRSNQKLNRNRNHIWKCVYCEAIFPSLSKLTEHKRHQHKRVGWRTCPHCEKKFYGKHKFQDHLRTHTNERPFLCSECGRTFKLKQSLNSHMKILHRNGDGEIYICKYCGKESNSKCKMDSHERLHEEKGRICPHCKRKFSNPCYLKTHIDSVHLRLRKHACHLCDKRFLRHEHLSRHVATHAKPNRRNKGYHIQRPWKPHRQNKTTVWRVFQQDDDNDDDEQIRKENENTENEGDVKINQEAMVLAKGEEAVNEIEVNTEETIANEVEITQATNEEASAVGFTEEPKMPLLILVNKEPDLITEETEGSHSEEKGRGVNET